MPPASWPCIVKRAEETSHAAPLLEGLSQAVAGYMSRGNESGDKRERKGSISHAQQGNRKSCRLTCLRSLQGELRPTRARQAFVSAARAAHLKVLPDDERRLRSRAASPRRKVVVRRRALEAGRSTSDHFPLPGQAEAFSFPGFLLSSTGHGSRRHGCSEFGSECILLGEVLEVFRRTTNDRSGLHDLRG
ncbi:DUF982 domain-containing protein [Rhizobium leguminosarum bv. viciae]|nr:DUF982 domain-containing protein [Rhizobium leguminosarum bv. viciae]